ncbi:4-aminobutyrate--2-oxoglutarate transaminase [Achromobacter sp. UMC46]|uniref:4-aminobutyrate--2-oxoglutarate transaminase n=1 Tax=Achromobacter sp. UMC46 TaxID=1862319 RepID=UPI001604638B|nr:4-aminobutyrate transaminase [Achromobacter sp. UMC46]
MSQQNTFNERRKAAIPAGLAQHLDMMIDRAENAEYWDEAGKRYIDFGAGIAVANTGHRHPKVIARVKLQLDRYTHLSFQTTPYEGYLALCERLNALAPGDFPKKTFLVNTGAEANENAIKVARAATGRSAFVAFSGAFHGRTLMTMSLTGKTVPYKAGFGPLVPDVYHVPFPTPYRGITEADSLRALDTLFKSEVDPSRVAGIIIEPVQGEGGFNPASASLMKSLRQLCDTHGILLIADEIQTGFCRTGRMFAMDHLGVAPDIITMAKGLGGGFPIAAITGRASVMDKIPAGGLGSTFAGNPLSCAAALAVIDVLAEEKLAERAVQVGERVMRRFKAWSDDERFGCVGNVRGLGAMVAVEFVKDRETREPWPEVVKTLTRVAADRGLILLTCGVYGNVVRVLAPLTIPFDQLEEGLDIFEAALHASLAELQEPA